MVTLDNIDNTFQKMGYYKIPLSVKELKAEY